MAQGLQRYCRDEFEFWARCKRASILFDWIEGTSVDDLERRYSTTPFQGAVGYGDIIRTADGARFHLRSAHQILSALFPEQPAFLAAFDELLRRLEFGLPAAALGLTELPVALSRGQYFALFAAGAGTVAAVRVLDRQTLTRSVGKISGYILGKKISHPIGLVQTFKNRGRNIRSRSCARCSPRAAGRRRTS